MTELEKLNFRLFEIMSEIPMIENTKEGRQKLEELNKEIKDINKKLLTIWREKTITQYHSPGLKTGEIVGIVSVVVVIFVIIVLITIHFKNKFKKQKASKIKWVE